MRCAAIVVTGAPDRVIAKVLRLSPADLDDRFSRFDKGICIRKRLQQERLEVRVRHVAGCDPDHLGRGAGSLNQADEILILRHHDDAGISGLIEYFPILGVAQSKIADVDAFDSECGFHPPRELGGNLGIEPDNHTASMGWPTR
jgi:hypothetical protein